MKKTGESKTLLRKTKKPFKAASNNGFKTEQRLESRASELNPSEEITLPVRKRSSPAADEEME